MPVALWEAQTLQNHSADADAVPGCRAPLGERRFLSTHNSFRLGLKRCVHRPSKRETGQAVRLCPPGARGASLRLDRPIGWLSTLGLKGVLGPSQDWFIPAKTEQPLQGLAFISGLTTQNNGSLGGCSTAATPVWLFLPCTGPAHSLPRLWECSRHGCPLILLLNVSAL